MRLLQRTITGSLSLSLLVTGASVASAETTPTDDATTDVASVEVAEYDVSEIEEVAEKAVESSAFSNRSLRSSKALGGEAAEHLSEQAHPSCVTTTSSLSRPYAPRTWFDAPNHDQTPKLPAPTSPTVRVRK